MIVFGVLLVLASKAGLMGIPLALILTSWFFKYAYILFDHTVRGFDEPPTLDIQMLNPLDEQRPLAQVVILGLIYAGTKLAQSSFGSTTAAIIGVAAVLVLPASVAVLGLERNILKAVYPVALGKMIIGLGPFYALVLGIIASFALILGWLGTRGLWLSLELILGMFAFLSIFSVLGGVVYERRHELGLETWVSPERTDERRQQQELRQSEATVTEAYGLMRVGSHTEAWAVLQTWLSARGYAAEDYRWLCARVAQWHDPRYITRLNEEHIDRLLALKRTGEALDIAAARLRVDPAFRPKSAVSTLKIAQLAAQGGGSPAVARSLLSDYAARFPGDLHLAAAASLARSLET